MKISVAIKCLHSLIDTAEDRKPLHTWMIDDAITALRAIENKLAEQETKIDKYCPAYDYLVDKGRIDEDTGNVVS